MAIFIQGEVVRFDGRTGRAIIPRERLGWGWFINPSAEDINNLAIVAEEVGYGLVVARICFEKSEARKLIGRGTSELDVKSFAHEYEAKEVADIFNSKVNR